MPLLQRDQLQFAILFLCVPIQYLVVQYSGSSESTRTYHISLIVKQLQDFQQQWFSLETWRQWCLDLLKPVPVDPGQGESIATEVFKYREEINSGHFASSTEPRKTRKPIVKFRVGQVVKHKLFGYRGVIVGWDETAQAPDFWIEQMHGKNKPEWKSQPNYSVLVDTRDRTGTPQTTYVVQENIEVITKTKVLHPKVEDHFESYDGSQYIPRPWLRTLYPLD